MELPANWNSYGALPVNHLAIGNAARLAMNSMNQLVPAPTVVPTNRGNVRLEWHRDGVDLEVEVYPTGQFTAASERHGEERELNGSIYATDELKGLIDSYWPSLEADARRRAG
jgi:hypothetical protein